MFNPRMKYRWEYMATGALERPWRDINVDPQTPSDPKHVFSMIFRGPQCFNTRIQWNQWNHGICGNSGIQDLQRIYEIYGIHAVHWFLRLIGMAGVGFLNTAYRASFGILQKNRINRVWGQREPGGPCITTIRMVIAISSVQIFLSIFHCRLTFPLCHYRKFVISTISR